MARFGLAQERADPIHRLLAALEREPNPATAVTDPAQALAVHVADSLVGVRVPGTPLAGRIADVGAGAGFPGLPLAIALPDATVDLIESNRRKVAVIERLAAAAGVENARAIPARAEEWATAEERGAYDVVTARAVAPLAVLVEYAAPLLRVGGRLVAWKGARDRVEEERGDRAAARLGLSPGEAHHVVPFPEAHSRHLHVYAKLDPTPEGFPRRPGMAVKRPLG